MFWIFTSTGCNSKLIIIVLFLKFYFAKVNKFL
nr:MAG TPA: hypothetical protein [Caudoviricetes sp.]